MSDEIPLSVVQHPAPQINSTTYRTASLDSWQEAFWEVYGDRDSTLKLYDMMLQLVVDSTRMSEAIRKRKYEEALSCLPRIFSWMCNMSTKCARSSDLHDVNHKKLSEIIWFKYPRLCSLCAESRCVCPTLRPDDLTPADRQKFEKSKEDKRKRARREHSPPEALDDWVNMFDDIYGTVNASRDAPTKVLHFWEEIGELEVEARKADRKRNHAIPAGQEKQHATIEWDLEMADVFSWMASIYLHIDGSLTRANRFLTQYNERVRTLHLPGTSRQSRIQHYPFSEWIWVEFRHPELNAMACHRCGGRQCRCTIGFERR